MNERISAATSMQTLEVVGRHVLLFDDDATASFINSVDALVDWNALLIDRYDVRHLLSSPPPPRRTTTIPHHCYSSIDSELDHDRYLDLPPPPPPPPPPYNDQQESDQGSKPVNAGGYGAVGFSYGNPDDPADHNNDNAGLGSSGFCPPFPVPESLLQNLPPSEKVHQIIARTAMFVSKHGGQSEIVLRVKQGDNPSFGFLMPDHHLHAYFRFLVDHQEVLQFDIDGKPQSEEQKANIDHNQADGVAAGALSLLGSVYESGEDEDGVSEDVLESKKFVSGETFDTLSATVSHDSEKTESSVNAASKHESLYKNPVPSKEKAPVLKRNSIINVSKAASTSSTRKSDSSTSLSATADKLQSSAAVMSKIEPLILDPPSDLKSLVDKIVEFIMKNGKQFEAVLVEQDSKHGRFPFLLPCNQYHPYYLKVLQEAQEVKLTGNRSLSKKDDSLRFGLDKKSSLYKESDILSSGSGGSDIPYDSDRKEKFKMVIGKSKKEGQDPPSKAIQPPIGVNVDAAAVAAILQAATRGIKYPNFGILSRASMNSNGHGSSTEGGQASSLGSLPSSQPEGVIQKSNQNDNRIPLPVAKAMARTAAVEVASEADSSEAHLTREQKLKAERLKRAKMFVAMLKSGTAPSKAESMRDLSVEPQELGVSGSGVEVNLAAKEKEGSSAPLGIDTSNKYEESKKTNLGDEFHKRRSSRTYRSRSGKHEEKKVEEEEDDDDDDDDDDDNDNEIELKHSRKKHRSHHSSHKDDDEEIDNKRSRKRHQSHHSSQVDDGEEDEERYHKHSRRKHRSHHSSHEDEEDDDEDERDHKLSRKKHRSHRSSHEYEADRYHSHSNKNRSPCSLLELDDTDEDCEGRDNKHSRKKHRSHHSSHCTSKHKHKKGHSSSKHRESRRKCELDSSFDEENRHLDKSNKHRKKSNLDREELEEGEISSRISDQSRGSVAVGVSREASVDLTSSSRDRGPPSKPSETTEVSEDLRAKIRAMLMETL